MSKILYFIAIVSFGAASFSSRVSAQGQQPFGGPVGAQGQQGPDDDKEGPAEAAPTTKASLLPTTRVLPQPKNRKKRLDVFSIDGYFRWRGDWFKSFNLGYISNPDDGGAPFPESLACQNQATTGTLCADSKALKSSNLRLRLEPVIHLNEKSSVHMQLDVLDNKVLGSDPNGLTLDGSARPGNVPISGLTDGQVASGQTLLVKRAWAEIVTPVGLLKFGRMPWHWGLGISANASGYDPIHDTYDLDGDYGDNVDRLSMAALIPGTELEASVAMDWVSTSPTADQTDAFANTQRGQPWDLEDHDDVNQWVFTLARMDSPLDIENKLANGEWVLNYGGFLAYRTQDWEQANVRLGEAPPSEDFVVRELEIYQPDFWLRLAKGNMNFEMEGTAYLGNIANLSDLGVTGDVNIRSFGGVARLDYRVLDQKLLIQGEVGYASGDQFDNSPEGATHVSNSVLFPPSPNDNTISAFRFDFGYNIDLILFRELLGTVTNATYIKPKVRYDINENFYVSGQTVLSIANNKVSTPGNGNFYGLELDADAGFQSDGYFAGVAYGVFFPMSAMSHPPGSEFGFTAQNSDDFITQERAQTIQFRMGLKF